MKNSILRNTGVLPIAAGFMLMPSLFFAQTEKQIAAIKKETDLSTLTKFSKSLKKTTLTTSQLKKKAQSSGLVFSGNHNGRYFELRGFDKKGNPLYYITDNIGAAAGTGASKLNSTAGIFNLDGENMRVHEWDGGGTLVSHQEFGGRAVQKDVPKASSDHATHVAGTIIASGVTEKAKGMAPKALLDAYDWTDDTTEMVDAAQNGAILSNHSYGFIGGFTYTNLSKKTGWHWIGGDDDTRYKYYGKYSSIDAHWDLIANNAPFYLPVKAAGNPRGDGPDLGGEHFVRVKNATTGALEWVTSTKIREKNGGDLGFDCINHGALGKNILIVGAANKIPTGYKKPTDVTMASFSAFGPVDDGRIKPDIAGIGVDVYSTNNTKDDAYTTMSGTSMASPNVTGSLLLLQEHYKKLNQDKFMKAATLKALAIHTANEAGEYDGPDYASGWGLLNAYKAATTISVKDKYALIEEKTLQNNSVEKINVVASGSEPLAVTIVWSDPVNDKLSDPDKLDDRDTKALVNDLDIRVNYNGETFFPWKLNPDDPAAAATKGDNTVDNVENIVIPNPVPGATYEIVISHKGTLKKNKLEEKDGETIVLLEDGTEQTYSFIATGINNGVEKDLALNSITPKVSSAEYTANTPVEFEVVNKGTQKITNAQLSYKFINLDNNNEVIDSGNIHLGDIEANTNIKKEISFNLAKSFTNYKIEGSVSSAEDQIEFNNKSEVSLFGILADLTQPKSSHSFDFEDDAKKNGWETEDTDKDGSTWIQYNDRTFARSGVNFALNFPNKVGTNDWLFSNPIKLKAGKLYRVSLYSRKFQATAEEPFGIYLGSSPSSAAMTKEIQKKVDAGLIYGLYHYEFTSDTNQIAYLGFNHNKPDTEMSYALAIDDVRIDYAEGAPLVDFTANKVNPNTYETVTFTNQTLTASTQPVTATEWIFEPNTIEYQDGTNANSTEPKVVFNQEGTYRVSLKVTNSEGTEINAKDAYITAKNTATKADFKVSSASIDQGESVVFTNTSTGNPVPTEFKWTVTPSDGVEFTSGTNETSTNAVVKFKNDGIYTVSLLAKSAHNEDVVEKKDAIKVASMYGSVVNLQHTLDNTTGDLNLTWERPILKEIYNENFNDFVGAPANMKIIDANNDRNRWATSPNIGVSGTRGIFSRSWSIAAKAFSADDYLVLPKLRKGAEVLKYDVEHRQKERYDVYIVEAPASGLAPTVDEIKQGHKVYSFDASEWNRRFVNREISIKDYTLKDFFVVFHHRTKKEDDGYNLVLDNISVGYDNTKKSGSKIANGDESNNELSVKELIAEGKVLVEEKDDVEKHILPQNDINVEFGVLDTPELIGYEVVRDNVSMQNITDISKLSYQETLNQKGVYVYDVYAVYSGNKKSERTSVTVDFNSLSTSEVKDSGLKIYPNPSDGRFVIEAKTNITSLKAEVYDMSGKLIFKNQFKGNKADLNLTQYPKGVYILNLVDNNGEKHSAKLMIK